MKGEAVDENCNPSLARPVQKATESRSLSTICSEDCSESVSGETLENDDRQAVTGVARIDSPRWQGERQGLTNATYDPGARVCGESTAFRSSAGRERRLEDEGRSLCCEADMQDVGAIGL